MLGPGSKGFPLLAEISLLKKNYHAGFIDEEAGAPRGEMTCTKSQGKLEVEQTRTQTFHLPGQSSDHYGRGGTSGDPCGVSQTMQRVAPQAGWVSSREALGSCSALHLEIQASPSWCHLACCTQPNSTMQSVQLTSLTVMFRSKSRKLLVSAYLSAFIKWNKLFLNTRVANSLRGN